MVAAARLACRFIVGGRLAPTATQARPARKERPEKASVAVIGADAVFTLIFYSYGLFATI